MGVLHHANLMSKLLGLLSDDEIYVTFIPKQISRHGKYYQGLCHMGLEIGLCPPGNLQSLWWSLVELIRSLKIAAVVHSLHWGCHFMCKHLQVVVQKNIPFQSKSCDSIPFER